MSWPFSNSSLAFIHVGTWHALFLRLHGALWFSGAFVLNMLSEAPFMHELFTFCLFPWWLKLSISCPSPPGQLSTIYICQLWTLHVIQISRYPSYLFNAQCYLSPEERMSIGKWWHCNSVMCKWEVRDYITCLSHFFNQLLSKYWTMTLKPKKASLCKGHSGHVAGLMTPTSVMECNQRLACFDYPVFFFFSGNRCLVEVFLIFFQ